MDIPFTKMVGAGNDFVVVDNRSGIIPEGPGRRDLFAAWCHRRFGIGADGVLLVEPDDSLDFSMRYYNADGGEAEMCGNGGRCIARFAHLTGIAAKEMTFRSAAGHHTASILGSDVKLGMTDPTDLELRVSLPLAGGEREVHLINTGVPHVVEFVDDVTQTPVVELGREIRYHERFAPAGTNANFITPVDRHTFRIRTYERGVEDETLACGTGTTGAAIVGAILGHFDPPVTGITQSGLKLTIHFEMNENDVHSVYLEGNADIAFAGTVSAAT